MAERVRSKAHHLVPSRMSKGVVDPFEMIKVHLQDAKGMAASDGETERISDNLRLSCSYSLNRNSVNVARKRGRV